MSQRRSLRVLTALVGALALTATSAFAAGIQDPIPAPIPPAGVDIALETVASGLVSPVAAARAPGDGHHLFIADQNGMLWGVTVHGHGGRRRQVARRRPLGAPGPETSRR